MTDKKEFNNVQQFLTYLQKNLNAPKKQFNNFGKYAYRNVEDIMEGIKPLLVEESYVTCSDELVMIGNRYYIKATATVGFKGESIIGHGYARESESRKGMDDSQLTGSTSSYARKYALGGLLLVDDNKDADSSKPDPKNAKSKQDVTSAQAVSGSMASNLDRDTQIQMRDTAVTFMSKCAKLKALDDYSKKHGKSWRKNLDTDLVKDIVDAYAKYKKEIGDSNV